MPASILVFGATGLVGSHLIVALKKTHPDLPLTLYIRDNSETMRDYLINTVGIERIVIGDFSENDKIAKLTAEHEIVINSGSSWDVPLTKAIIQGLKNRYDEGKGKGSLIHLSGTGNFVDGGKDGKYSSESKVWNVSDRVSLLSIFVFQIELTTTSQLGRQ
jgi:nucleoside-diphosphate-sugar epimerase